jgi:hypothetical protein
MFWRRRLKGTDFAEALVVKISKSVHEDWSRFATTVQNAAEEMISGIRKPVIHESHAPFVIMAAVFADLQAFRNLRERSDFRSQFDYIVLRLGGITMKPRTTGGYRRQFDYIVLIQYVFGIFARATNMDAVAVRELFAAYEKGFHEAIERGENPIAFGIGSVLYGLLEIPLSKTEGGEEFQNPLVLSLLGELLMSYIGFTKFAFEKYKIQI